MMNYAKGYGGGAYIVGGLESTITLINNIFHNNEATSCGGDAYISIISGYLTLTNNTFTNNLNSSSNGYGGGGIFANFYYNTAIADFYNNIIWGNTAANDLGQDIYLEDRDSTHGGGASIDFHYNDFNNLDYEDGSGLIANNNINQDPLFVNDFLLSDNSPCIDEGSDAAPMLPKDDFSGKLRDLLPDMGADEFVPKDVYVICIGTSDDLCNNLALNVSEALTYTIEDTDLNYIRIRDMDVADEGFILSEKVQLGIESGTLTIF